MIKYLIERNCPKCSGEFVVVLLRRTPWMQSINGFCGDCDYCIEWNLIRKKTFPAHQTTERKAVVSLQLIDDAVGGVALGVEDVCTIAAVMHASAHVRQ